jgi:hypothetical protein
MVGLDLNYQRNSTSLAGIRYIFAMLHPLELPTLDPMTACVECREFVHSLSALMRSRDADLEHAFDSIEVENLEERFKREYRELFLCWMDHKLSHETGSLRRYIAILSVQ